MKRATLIADLRRPVHVEPVYESDTESVNPHEMMYSWVENLLECIPYDRLKSESMRLAVLFALFLIFISDRDRMLNMCPSSIGSWYNLFAAAVFFCSIFGCLSYFLV